MPSEIPKFRPEKQASNDELFRHTLIQKEFRTILEKGEYVLNDNTGAIMILSAPPNDVGDNFSKEKEKNEENIARIQLGIDVYKEIASQKLKKIIEQLTEKDLLDPALPPLVLNGETEQLPAMKEIAVTDLHFPTEKIIEINCGNRGVANTRTQFEVLHNNPIMKELQHITLITTAYHNPRVARTASSQLPQTMDFDVIGVPFKDLKFDVYKKVRGEVKRILAYSERGDISKYPRL